MAEAMDPNIPIREMKSSDLWQAHWTDPSSMDGVSRLRQHDNFHRQLGAFQRLTEVAEKKFSKDALYQMLRVLTKGVPQLRASKRASKEEESFSPDINSVRKLQEAVAAFQKTKRRGIQKEEAAHVVKFFQNFQKDVDRLSDYKQYFDEKIYKCLYEYFYDPSEDTSLEHHPPYTGRSVTVSRHGHSRDLWVSDDGDSGNYSDDLSPKQRRSISPRRTVFDKTTESGSRSLQLPTLDEFPTKEKWSWAVRELQAINKRWQNLLTKDGFDKADFEEDSEMEVLHYPCRDQFVLLLRFLPDIFVKSHKCLQLAKIWWTEANKFLKFFPVRNHGASDFEEKTKSIRRQIQQLDETLVKGQKNLEEFQVVLKTTATREKRAEELASDCEHLEQLKIQAEQKYNHCLGERRALVRKFEYAIKGTSKYFELKSQLKNHDRLVSESYNALRVLRYQFEIMHDDFLIEIEVRPSFIRFTDHIKEMISSLKNTLVKTKAAKRQCEKELTLIKTNCETMRSVMQYQIGGVKSFPPIPPNQGRKPLSTKERDNTYDVISTPSTERSSRITVKQDVFSPVWSESERSDGVQDGHEADTETAAAEEYSFAKYTRLLDAERKSRPNQNPRKPKPKSKSVRKASKLPRPTVKH